MGWHLNTHNSQAHMVKEVFNLTMGLGSYFNFSRIQMKGTQYVGRMAPAIIGYEDKDNLNIHLFT